MFFVEFFKVNPIITAVVNSNYLLTDKPHQIDLMFGSSLPGRSACPSPVPSPGERLERGLRELVAIRPRAQQGEPLVICSWRSVCG